MVSGDEFDHRLSLSDRNILALDWQGGECDAAANTKDSCVCDCPEDPSRWVRLGRWLRPGKHANRIKKKQAKKNNPYKSQTKEKFYKFSVENMTLADVDHPAKELLVYHDYDDSFGTPKKNAFLRLFDGKRKIRRRALMGALDDLPVCIACGRNGKILKTKADTPPAPAPAVDPMLPTR